LQIFDKPDSLLPDLERGVGLGFFDGVHRGHIELLRVLIFKSQEMSLLPAVYTFPVHPETILNPDDLFTCYLGDLPARLELLAASGIEEIHLQMFNQEFAAMEPGEFLDQILVERLKARLIVVGSDYRFGCGGRGDITLLRQWAAAHRVEIIVVPQISMFGDKISSSRIRSLISEGDLVLAASLLGRPYRLSGQVVTGRGLGHHLGFPTANIPVPSYLACPAFGVYATRTVVAGRAYESITNIGLRPTVEAGNAQPLMETCLLDVELDLYGQDIQIDFLERLRPEERFQSVEELGKQVSQDVAAVRKWHQVNEQGYELMHCNDISLSVLPTRRFAQSSLHMIFYTPLDARRSACQTLLMRVLTASCRRHPTRTSLAAALDNLYGSSIEATLEKQGDLQQIDLEAEGLISWTDGSSPFLETCELAFELLFDPLLDQYGLFDAATVETERKGLLLEMASRENDRAKYAYDRCMAVFCGGQVQGILPAGGSEWVSQVSQEDLALAYRDLLANTRVDLYLGGAVDKPVIEACLSGIRRFPAGNRPAYRPGRYPSPFISAKPASVMEQKRVEQARIALAYTGMPPYFSHQSIQATVLNSMLGGDVHSLLFEVVREKLGLAYSVFSMNQRCLGALLIMAGVAPEQVEAALKAVLQQMEDLAAGRFESSLFARSCRMIETALLSSGDDLSSLISRQINGQLYGRNMTLAESVGLLQDVTPEDIIRLASQLRLVTTYILATEDQK
jgi:riboflavin kinase / FMN adenylyltransferase